MELSQEAQTQVNIWFSSLEVKRKFVDLIDAKEGIKITQIENGHFEGKINQTM